MELILIMITAVMLAMGAGIVYLGWRFINVDDVSPRLKTFVEELPTSGHAPKGVSLRPREFSGSLINRVFMPVIRSLGNSLNRLTPQQNIENLQHKLYIAGYPFGLGAREFFGLRLLLIIGSVVLSLFILRIDNRQEMLLASLAIIMLTTFIPPLWLNGKVRTRKELYRRGLPDALDMLSICVQAGLGFDQALQRVSQQWQTPIASEFGRVVSEIEMGLARRVALRNLADRLDVNELSSFVAIIIQAEQLGMSVSDTLHSQADQMRAERYYMAQEQARIIPLKMLLPLTFLIFPAIMAVLLAPALPDLISLFTNM